MNNFWSNLCGIEEKIKKLIENKKSLDEKTQ
jgi:hypothetical protein